MYPVNSSSILPGVGKIQPISGGGANQNSEEEGVFLSQAALEQMKKDAEERERQRGNQRQLLLADSIDYSFSLRPVEIKAFLTILEPTDALDDELALEQRKRWEEERKERERQRAEIEKNRTKITQTGQTSSILPQIYVSNIEVKSMLIFTVIGVGLIVVTYLKLSSRGKRRVKLSPLNV